MPEDSKKAVIITEYLVVSWTLQLAKEYPRMADEERIFQLCLALQSSWDKLEKAKKALRWYAAECGPLMARTTLRDLEED